MTKTAIMTDSNSGITMQKAKELGIYLLSMPFMIDEKSYYEGVDINLDQFYELLASGANVSTSQPSPGAVLDMWDSLLEGDYDEVVYIPMSSGLSQSCACAMGLALEYDGKVQVIDNRRISVTMKHSVEQAAELAKTGMGATEIKEILEKQSLDATIYITVDTLEYLKKGGRVTTAGAAIGSILNIKPVLTIQGDKLDAFAKVRGMKAARRSMITAMKNDLDTRLNEFYSKGEICLYAVYSYVDDDIKLDWKSEIQEAFPDLEVLEDHLSMSVGCHIGAGALAIAACRR